MKNNIIIRIENTLFNTKRFESLLAKTKDKDNFFRNGLAKCKLNEQFVEVVELLNVVHAMKNVNVNVVTDFKFEYMYKLLSINKLQYANLFSAMERAIVCDNSAIVISANDDDLQCARQKGVDCIKFPIDKDAIFNAIGVRKHVKKARKAA